MLVGVSTSPSSGGRVSGAEAAGGSGHSSYPAERTCASKTFLSKEYLGRIHRDLGHFAKYHL